jgi:hypothetical protein
MANFASRYEPQYLLTSVQRASRSRYNRGMSDPLRILATFLLLVIGGYLVRATYRRWND